MQMMKVMFQVTIALCNLRLRLFLSPILFLSNRLFSVDVLVFACASLTLGLDSMRSLFLTCRCRLISSMELILQILRVLKKIVMCHIVGCCKLRVVSIRSV